MCDKLINHETWFFELVEDSRGVHLQARRDGSKEWLRLVTINEDGIHLWQTAEVGSAETTLTKRELEIVCQICQGKSNKEVGIALNISPQTVKNHLSTVFRKLGIFDRTQAALYALQQGWIVS